MTKDAKTPPKTSAPKEGAKKGNPAKGSAKEQAGAQSIFDMPFFDMQGTAMREMFAGALAGQPGLGDPAGGNTAEGADSGDVTEWAKTAAQIQQVWMDYLTSLAGEGDGADGSSSKPLTMEQWFIISRGMMQNIPAGMIEAQGKFARDAMDLWQGVFGQMAQNAQTMLGDLSGDKGSGSKADTDKIQTAPPLPKSDRRFSAPEWQEYPAFALLHQTYLMLAEYFSGTARSMHGLDNEKRRQLEFAVNALTEAMSPGNFLLTNPVVMKRTVETRGQNLLRGMTNLIADLKRGQLTHTDPNAFSVGENLAVTPGKVVFETPLYQLIQYTPTTPDVLKTPLIIFPPWINRFYILDLNPRKSFIKWAVDHGISVFVVSWKSADENLADVVWDDYIRAQIEAIDTVRARLAVPDVHTIGYCVSGTTLAAVLAILAQRGEADKVKSATFFTAQVDFEHSGDLKHFIDDPQLEMIGQLSPEGYLDGRYLAATFNALRGKDLIWNYVVNNYLLGEEYPAFDLLYWNGDVTNLPARWHNNYLRDLYRDNKLVVPNALSADGTPIDLTQVKTPSFVQAGREDHIAPAQSVWRITDNFSGPVHFVLAGSGHIAGVVNPPAANKYQYWLGDSDARSLDAFIESAVEHPGSWWPHWLEWLHKQDGEQVAVKGKRKPGGRGDRVIEDAPGRYVKER